MSLLLLNPIQEAIETNHESAPRLSTLDGKILGLYSNEKLNASNLLTMIAEELAVDFKFEVKRGLYNVHKLMTSAEWGDIEQCDAVILANGDCGACSSSGIVNAIELEKRGLPTMLVSTPAFREAIITMARFSGMPGITWATVEHPIGSLENEALRLRAKDAAAQFKQIILRG